MLSIHKPFPTFRTTTVGAAVFVVGLTGSLALLTYLHPDSTDKGSTASVASKDDSSEGAGSTPKATSTAGSSSSAKTDKASKEATPTSTSPILASPTQQEPARYLQPASNQAATGSVAPAPSKTVQSAPSIVSSPIQPSAPTTSTSPSAPTSSTPVPSGTTSTPTSDSSITDTLSGTVQQTTDALSLDGTKLNLPLQ